MVVLYLKYFQIKNNIFNDSWWCCGSEDWANF